MKINKSRREIKIWIQIFDECLCKLHDTSCHVPLCKDIIIHGWFNMCDPHSERLKCSISPLCVFVWRDSHSLQQALSARLQSIYPPMWSNDTALWHLLISHCCQGNRYSDALQLSVQAKTSSTTTHTINTRAALCGQDPEHVSDVASLTELFVWCSCPNRECDAAHPP